MDRIVVTDLLGDNNIDNSTPFIVINVGAPEKLIRYLDGVEKNRLFRFVPKSVYYVLKRNGLNPKNFVHCGDLWFPERRVGDANFLLVNKKYVKETKNFVLLAKFANGAVYKPVPEYGYSSISLVYASRNFEPKKTYLIESRFIKASGLRCDGPVCRAGVFNYLGSSLSANNDIDQKKIIEIFSKPQEDNDTESYDSWITRQGRNVILVKPDTPWFISKGKMAHDIHTKHIKPVFKNPEVYGEDSKTVESDWAAYKTGQEIDNTVPHLGYGYSYLSRLEGVNCKTKESDDIYEMFSQNKKKSHIIYLLYILMFIVLIYFTVYTFIELAK